MIWFSFRHRFRTIARYNNARTIQLVLVSNDIGGATSQSDSLLALTFCTARALSSNTIQTVNYFSVLSLTASLFVELHIICLLQYFTSLNRCSNNQSFYFHYYVVFSLYYNISNLINLYDKVYNGF